MKERETTMNKKTFAIRNSLFAAAAVLGAMAAHADEVPCPPEPQNGTAIGLLCALGCAGLALLFVLVRKMRRTREGK